MANDFALRILRSGTFVERNEEVRFAFQIPNREQKEEERK